MAQKEEHPLLQKPLYVFDLPQDILSTIALKDQAGQTQTQAAEDNAASPSPAQPAAESRPETPDNAPAAATSCALCNLNFPSLQEQRSHVRSDLHGYNLKQKMRGQKPVGEGEFEKLVGELDESISGSESSESDSDDEKETTLSALLKKQAKISNPEFDDFAPKKRKRGAGKPPLLWFTSPALPSEVSLGVYRAILSDAEQEEEAHVVETIRNKQLPPMPPPGQKKASEEDEGGVRLPAAPEIGPHYFLCMIGGGHFAAMIVSLAPKMGKKHTGMDERQATVVAHKTFHRYTTRRKQGGSQSASDAARGAAHSAGSSLRRYNEAALTQDVRNLLKEWKDMIDSADLLFIRATGSTNRRTLFGPYEGQVLKHNDPRNRGFPFSTRRATQAELMRSFVELTRVKVSRVDEAAIAAAAAAAAAAQASSEASSRTATPSKPKPPKPTPEEEEATLHTTQLQALIRRSKAPAIVNYLASNQLSPDFRFHPRDTEKNYHAPTPLHLAAHVGAPAVVTALLVKARADPAVRNLEERTPYELCSDRATRDAFRIARAERGDEGGAIDWDGAGVPAALARGGGDAAGEEGGGG
ncbi:uncharacterized protein K452DRAFT_152726 [Aplosporella prunicola CBS 121167]|uniref:VLRF1 domain-containing protein n=1 Tax=Aplosporella prunicola CBS 121167 TaxID=1176127 RepID=A0A6A6BLE0_9PEZI|nr:uncharacterized protein K452DRAFT_152726 [Aplosporella prunicola CBS 121167]KAF2144084.1 hypothetical protein K452DRAFT_152726 [Aplosporella prunicola CBS 121167]